MLRNLSLLLALAIALPAAAQEPAPAAPEKVSAKKRIGPYLGVQPGAKDLAPGKDRIRSRGAIRVLTWVGFQMLGQGGRVFLQTSEPPVYTLVPGAADEVVIELPDTRLHSRNDGRPLDSAWFPTAIASIDADQLRGNVVRVRIKLREVVGYDMRQEGNYLFLDFRPPTKPIEPPPLPGAPKATPPPAEPT
jgi:hypothetical protein